MSEFAKRHSYTLSDVVAALNAGRQRSALSALRWLFEHQSDVPHRLILTCAELLNASDPTRADLLIRIRGIRADLDQLDADQARLFTTCVYSTETRADLLSDPNTLAAALRQHPKPLAQARRSLRWLSAQTEGAERRAAKICQTLLTNPSATHPLVVDAVKDSHRLWPDLTASYRALILSCVYASTERATQARQRRDAQTRELEADSGDVHRCGNCDGNLAQAPDLPYCSDACRREGEAHEFERSTAPAPSQAATTREPAEARARRTYVEPGPIEAQYNERYREIVRDVPLTAVRARKDASVVDRYDDEQPAAFNDADEDTGYWRAEDEAEARAQRPVAPGALCVSCNLERPVAHRAADPLGRCTDCAEIDAPPLAAAQRSALIAA